MTRVIEPAKGRVLVKLGVSEYGDIPVPPKDYDSITYGTVVKVHADDEKQYGEWVGRLGYWKKYKDDMRVATLPSGETLALVPINDVDGTSYEE